MTELAKAPSTRLPGRRRRRPSLRSRKEATAGIVILAVLILLSLTASWWTDFTPSQVAGRPFDAPSAEHWLGTDDLGRDYLVRLLTAGQTSLFISVAAASLALVVGTAIGIAAGLRGGWLDSILMAGIDLVLSFPSLLLALSAVTVLDPTKPILIVVLTVISVPQFARVVRTSSMELRSREFVLSARVSGVSSWAIAIKHLVPNVLPLLAVQFANTAAIAILVESSLSYLGLGVQPPEPSWGNMIFASQNYMTQCPWLPLAPAGALLLASIGWGLVGEGFNAGKRSLI
ncbi:ABC transporter permease [Nocardioides nitrophenolicus]|uniref:ABC transporter permease n=1 Tax=Nocardioides nitrophenolicus TaxID=60489 RepID=UPI001958049C|nr:ABC transporter permease [Nocardioides nitrophenolicus]MBM7517080.1 ABC-type dipeptide/oligopeptide/nickel transport system permease subunit [Nocardioides nitrophenolicus]